MPSEDRSKSNNKGKEREKAESKEDAKSKSKSSSTGDKKPTVAEIKAEEYEAFITSCVTSHAGWLSTPLKNISPSLSLSIPNFSLILLSLFTLLLLLSPSSWIPHISAPIVLLIPLQNTLLAIAHEKRHTKHTKTSTGGDECIQWIVFWIGWIMLGWIGEVIRVFRPGWKGVWEIGRVGAGIVLAGPWFGRNALVPGKPSQKLVDAEKREAAEEAKSKKEAEKKKASGAEAGGGEEEKAKAKAKSKQKQREKEQAKMKEKKEKQD